MVPPLVFESVAGNLFGSLPLVILTRGKHL
jgi:hypothetical protein